MPNAEIVNYIPAPYVPSTSFSGSEQKYLIRGKNIWLKSKSQNQMYCQSYKGSKDINEPIPCEKITGTIQWNGTEPFFTGTDTLLTEEIRVGQFVVTKTTPSEMFVIDDVKDYLHGSASRSFNKNSFGDTEVYVLPVLYALGVKRATQICGNTVRFPRGHYLGVGRGEFRLNGETLTGESLALTRKPQFSLYNPLSGQYKTVGFGISLTAADPLFSLEMGAMGVKNMLAGDYGIVVVASSTDTGGYSQPSESVKITLAADHKIKIKFLAPMNTAEGQNAYDIYATKYIGSKENEENAIIGVLFYVETVTAAQLAAENSAEDGTISNLYHEFEFADGELAASNRILTYDNFEPYDAEFLNLINFTPLFFSCLGKRVNAESESTSPGAVVVPGKPDNPEAVMRDKAVATSEGDTILGVLSVQGRFWVLCENSLQAIDLTGIDVAPITCRSYWDTGFRNPYNARFFKDYIFGHSTNGFLRSIGVGDESSVDFEFSSPVDDYTTSWLTAHVLVGYCPKNKAICFFFSGYERANGFWKTLVLPFLPNQNIWNPPIILEHADRDFIVSGTATVGQALYFLAGGRTRSGEIECRTYEFDAPDDIEIECALAWTYSDFGAEDSPAQVNGIASLIGSVKDAKVEIHGVEASGAYDLNALENGHLLPLQTIELGSTNGFGRIEEKRQQIKPFSKFTPRLSFKSTNGNARVDELNLLVSSNSSRK